MAVATDDPHWDRNRTIAHAPPYGDDATMPRSAASDYARATMPQTALKMPGYAPPPPPVHPTAASRYGAAPRAPEQPYAVPDYAQPSYPAAPDYGQPAYPQADVAAQSYAPANAYVPEIAEETQPQLPPSRVAVMAQSVSRWTRYAGAAASVALVLGVAWWSYQLLMRDVNGVPVVRAMEGPMRVLPENPGGEVSTDTGLAVNAIAAVGTAAPPEEELALAPSTSGLTEEDLSVAVQPRSEQDEVEEAQIVDFSAFEAQPAPTAPAPQPVAEVVAAEPAVEAVAEIAEVADVAPATAAPATALRPQMRPAARAAAAEVAAAPAQAAPQVNGPLPSGTPLVQFGAYDSLELAGGEWTRLNGRFAALIGDKTRVIQEATSGGRTFFRLRAIGFADLAEARRFCSAMVAEGAECIPTVEP